MRIFAIFNFLSHSSASLCEVGHVAQKPFVPLKLLFICGSRPFPGPDADEYSNIPSRPFVHSSFFQDLGRWIVIARSIVKKNAFADLYRFERLLSRARSSASFPDRTIELRRWFFSRVVGSKENGVAMLGSTLKDSSYSATSGRLAYAS